MVGERAAEVLLGGDHDHRLLGEKVQERPEAIDGEHLRHVRAFACVLGCRELRQLPVLGLELRGGSDFHYVRIGQRALGERREPAKRLDLVAEELDPDCALLR